jgi:hypothetical protein
VGSITEKKILPENSRKAGHQFEIKRTLIDHTATGTQGGGGDFHSSRIQ